MNIIDTVLLVFLFLFALRGYGKGLVRESFTLGGLFLGFVVAVRYHEPLSTLLSARWHFSPVILIAATFISLFFAVYSAFGLAGWLLRSADISFLKGLDRVGGILLGIGEGAALLALLLFLLGSSPFASRQMRQRIEESYLIPPLHQLGQGLVSVGKDKLLPQAWLQPQVTRNSLVLFGP